jgi:hypothetical protein
MIVEEGQIDPKKVEKLEKFFQKHDQNFLKELQANPI